MVAYGVAFVTSAVTIIAGAVMLLLFRMVLLFRMSLLLLKSVHILYVLYLDLQQS